MSLKPLIAGMSQSNVSSPVSVIKVLAADETRTSTTTFADITGLAVPVVAGQKYLIELEAIFVGSFYGGGGGWKVQASDLTGWTRCRILTSANDASQAGGTAMERFGSTSYFAADDGGAGLGTYDSGLNLRGVYTASTTGTLTIQFAQSSSNGSPAIMRVGATLEAIPKP